MPALRAYKQFGLPAGKGGVRVTNVRPKSGAAKAGLKTNDVIVAINAHGVHSTSDVLSILSKRKPGDLVNIDFFRNKSARVLNVILGVNPE